MRRVAGFVAAIVVGSAGVASGAQLIVLVDGLRSRKGEIRVAVYGEQERETFPDAEAGMAAGVRIRAALVPPGAGRVRVSLGPIAPGRYAVSVVHDANANGQLDRNMLGVPTEGYGFSNAARGSLGPPSFEAAAVEVGAARDTTLSLAVTY